MLQGEADLYRVRVGDYRIIYQIRDAVLLVLVVQNGHRREFTAKSSQSSGRNAEAGFNMGLCV